MEFENVSFLGTPVSLTITCRFPPVKDGSEEEVHGSLELTDSPASLVSDLLTIEREVGTGGLTYHYDVRATQESASFDIGTVRLYRVLY